MAPHLCIQHPSQRTTNSFSLCDLTNTTSCSSTQALSDAESAMQAAADHFINVERT
jgi:hypothetical protein